MVQRANEGGEVGYIMDSENQDEVRFWSNWAEWRAGERPREDWGWIGRSWWPTIEEVRRVAFYSTDRHNESLSIGFRNLMARYAERVLRTDLREGMEANEGEFNLRPVANQEEIRVEISEDLNNFIAPRHHALPYAYTDDGTISWLNVALIRAVWQMDRRWDLPTPLYVHPEHHFYDAQRYVPPRFWHIMIDHYRQDFLTRNLYSSDFDFINNQGGLGFGDGDAVPGYINTAQQQQLLNIRGHGGESRVNDNVSDIRYIIHNAAIDPNNTSPAEVRRAVENAIAGDVAYNQWMNEVLPEELEVLPPHLQIRASDDLPLE